MNPEHEFAVVNKAMFAQTEKKPDRESVGEMSRKRAPVFVLGAPRSGTTLLYHMLLSAGGFAVYRSESDVFNLLEPKFGDLSLLRNKQKLLSVWLESKLFWRTGLDREQISRKILAECHNGGDFLRIVM